jgi:hypothetical protein
MGFNSAFKELNNYHKYISSEITDARFGGSYDGDHKVVSGWTQQCVIS